MDLSKWPLFRSGAFRQARYLVSTPRRVQLALRISETGVISLDPTPLATGYITSMAEKMSWLVVHQLKVRIKGKDDPALPISERSYAPLDPFDQFSEEDKKGLLQLWQIAKIKYAEKCANIQEGQFNASSLWHTALIGAFSVIITVLILHFIKH